jgi:hypothetical protein
MIAIVPVSPRLDYLGQARVALAAPLMIGPNLIAERQIIPSTGGRFEGEALCGSMPDRRDHAGRNWARPHALPECRASRFMDWYVSGQQ